MKIINKTKTFVKENPKTMVVIIVVTILFWLWNWFGGLQPSNMWPYR